MVEFHISGREFSRPVLGDIGIRFEPGESICLLGPSGCGKTTLLNIIAGLDKGYQQPIWQGETPTLAYLFQQPRLLPWRTVLDNLLLVNPDQDLAVALLAEVGLAEVINEFPTRLSLGMARRVALVRSLLLSPDLILMDEPLVSLDPVTARQMRELVERLVVANPERHLLYVTHDLDEALQIGDRILVLGGKPARIVSRFEKESVERRMLESALEA
jgi:NitT/TauT family transport system ATP-binding protein